MTITLIAAVARNRAIGKDNKLIYWLPDDLKRFKQLTTGHTVLMGRRTFDSLPHGALPNRRNVVLSSAVAARPSTDTVAVGGQLIDGAEWFASLDAALASCESDEEVYVIGGTSVYEQTIGWANRLCLTEIDDEPVGADAFFPEYLANWHEVSREVRETDERHAYRYAFVDYEKK